MDKKLFFYYTKDLHNAYKQIIDNAPPGFLITTGENMLWKGKGGSKTGFIKKTLRSLQPIISPYYNHLRVLTNQPKVFPFKSDEYDLVHSGQTILNTNLPYVLDFEHAASFSGFNQYAFDRAGFRKALKALLLNPKLKRLLAWTEAAKKSLTFFMDDEEIEAKTEVIYSVVSPPDNPETISHDGINFLFVGKMFYEKGAYEALLAFERISQRYDTTLTIVSNIPEGIKERFSSNSKIKFMSKIPSDELNRLYRQSDAMIFPTHFDTFGYVIPEAFSYGIPVISVDSFSIPELVEHERTGLIVHSPFSSFDERCAYRYPTVESLKRERLKASMEPSVKYVGQLSDAMKRIIEDGTLRQRMSDNARKETTEGMFSPKAWKGRMGRIYKESCEV